MNESELQKAKATLEFYIQQKGHFLYNRNINDTLEQINPTANNITFPTELLDDTNTISIKEPMIIFID